MRNAVEKTRCRTKYPYRHLPHLIAVLVQSANAIATAPLAIFINLLHLVIHSRTSLDTCTLIKVETSSCLKYTSITVIQDYVMRSNVAVYLALVSRCTLQVPNDLVTKAPASEYRFYRCLDMVARLGAAMRTEKTSTLQNRLHQSLDRPRQMARQFGLRFPERIRPDSGHVRALRPASTDQKMLSAARKMDGRSVLVDGVVYTVCIVDRNGSSPGCSNSYDPTRWSGSLRSRACSCRSTLA